MDNEKEFNGEVSSNTEQDGAHQPQAPASAEGTPASVTTVNCKKCGISTPRRGRNTKYCPQCTPTVADRLQKSRDRKKTASFVYDSKVEPTKAEAKELLATRGLKNPHVIDVCYDLGLRAAEQLGITPNKFYFQNGIAKTLASYEAKAPQTLDSVPDEAVVGELSNRAELVCIHDFSVAWREGWQNVDFAEFLRLRKLSKTDALELSMLLEKDFEACCQGEWTKFFPRFNPDTLKPRYTQKEMRLWLDSIDPVKDYLLLASRNSMKSSFLLIWAATLHLCAPDARVLFASETRGLSEGFIQGYRSIWEVKPNAETKLQILFPEYCIPTGSGTQDTFECPMAHLDLIAPSARATSYESATVGGRCDVLINDDPISNMTCGTEKQRQKSVDFYDLLQKLREVLGSFSVTVGTPWYADEDLYAVLIARNEREGNNTLAVRIDPIVTLRPQARYKLTPALLPTLTPEDVESYLLPVRMPWRFVKKEIAANPAFALSQNFIIFPKDSDEIKCQFDHDALWRRVRTMTELGTPVGIVNFMTLDRSWSASRFADFACAVVGRVQVVDGKQAAVIVDAKLERARESEVIDEMLVPLIALHKPRVLIFEEDRGWQDFETSLRKALVLRNIPVPWLRHIPIDNSPKAKIRRVKALELPIHQGRIFFNAAISQLEECLMQLEKFDGIHQSNSHRKDDFPDGLSILVDAILPKTHVEVAEEDEKKRAQRKEMEEQEYDRQRREAMRDRMFGGSSTRLHPQPSPPPVTVSEWARGQRGEPSFPIAPQPAQPAPRHFPRGGGFANIPGMKHLRKP